MNKHYDVALFGWWYADNYGSVLTYYALHQSIKKLGYSVLMLHEATGYSYGRKIWNNDSSIMKFALSHYETTEQCHFSEMIKYNQVCDTFVLGSDQLWNPLIDRVNDDCFLNFVIGNKRKISYATSFGNNDKKRFKPDFVKKYKPYLFALNAVSVREDYCVSLAEKIFNLKAYQTVDPVFLLNIDEYIYLAEHSTKKFEYEYLLAFILDPDEKKKNVVKDIAHKLDIDKIVVISNPDIKSYDQVNNIFSEYIVLSEMSPENFLQTYKDAKYIVTDSFHGTCFSYIFKKNFTSIYNYKRGADRFVYLLNLLNLVDRGIPDISNITQINLNDIDYVRLENNMEIEIKNSINWLKNALETPVEKLPSVDVKRVITDILKIEKCTGCSACVNICPTNALSLKSDVHGYYRSTIDQSLCIYCEKCVDTCPIITPVQNNNYKEPIAYEFIAQDENLLFTSASGGVFPLLAKQIFKEGGVVVGVAWREDFTVGHILIDKEEDLYKLQKSKYIQSYVGDIYRRIKENLNQGIKVLFSGCPCQVAGLRNFLNNDYDNLHLIDLLCHYSPSAKFFTKYLKDEFGENNVKHYEFRNKSVGWSADCHQVILKDGTKLVRRYEEDSYQRVFHTRIMMPYSCQYCFFSAIPRYGDITLGDFHGIDKNDENLSPNYIKGISVVLLNNEKGELLFNKIKSEAQICKEVPLKWLGGNGRTKPETYVSPKREIFFEAIKTMPFAKAVEYANNVPTSKYSFDVPKRNKNEEDNLKLPNLQYDSRMTHFYFDPKTWEEHFIKGKTVLFVKNNGSQRGNHAILPFNYNLEKGKKYKFSIRFKIKTSSPEINFHIYNSENKKFQVILLCKIENNENYQKYETMFTPDSDEYNSFMIGAVHLRGENSCIEFDYIYVSE